MSLIQLKCLTSAEARALSEHGGVVGLIPVGALEQHGPHLPLSMDSVLAERLAAAVAKDVVELVVVTPVPPGGLSDIHLAFPGTVSFSRDTLAGIIDAYVAAMKRMHVRRLGVISGHGGNFGLLGELAAKYATFDSQMKVVAYDDLDAFMKIMVNAGQRAGLHIEETDRHAGALETSLALYLLGLRRVRAFGEVQGYVAAEPGWLERVRSRGVQVVSGSGVLGLPRGATAEAGEAIFDALVEEVAGWLASAFGLRRVERESDHRDSRRLGGRGPGPRERA